MQAFCLGLPDLSKKDAGKDEKKKDAEREKKTTNFYVVDVTDNDVQKKKMCTEKIQSTC